MTEDLIASITSMRFNPKTKYAAKLDFAERCEILALYRLGVPRAVLAEAYGLDRRTITHIYNPRSVHYRAVRDMELYLGQEQFARRYVTVTGRNRVQRAINNQPAEQAKGNRTARRRAGVHIIKNDGMSTAHRINIQWHEAGLDNDGAGWYYQDLDGTTPDQWLHNGDDSRMTSQTCLDAATENLVEI